MPQPKRNTRPILWMSLCLTLTGSMLSAQVSPVQIEGIRRKATVAQTDIDTVRTFVSEQFTALLSTGRSRDLDDITRQLIANSVSINTAIRDAYSDAFSEAVRDAYKPVVTQAAQVTDPLLQARILLQVAIVLANMDNISLIDDLLEQLSSPSPEIRYWVTSSFSQPRIVNYLRNPATESQEVTRRVATRLSGALENEADATVITRMAMFAVNTIKTGESLELFKKCLTKRLESYKTWTVSQEQSDWELLQVIFETVRSQRIKDFKERETAIMRAAAELYQAAFERYFRGARFTVEEATVSLLDSESEAALMTILIEGEKNLLILTGNRRGPRVPSEIAKTRWTAFQQIIGTLTGTTGDIQQVYGIYSPDEVSKNALLVELAEPGQPVISAGVNRAQVRKPGGLLLPGLK